MSPTVFQIEIETSDSELSDALRSQQLSSLRLMHRAFTCDSAEWQPPIQEFLTIIIEVAKELEIGLLCNWLYERVKNTPPRKVTINQTLVLTDPEQLAAVLHQLGVSAKDVDKNCSNE